MDAAWNRSWILFLLALLLCYVIRRLGLGKLPRGLLPLPIIGHLHLVRGHPHHPLARLCARYGPVLLLRFGSRPVLVVASASATKECFTTNDLCFFNRPLLLSSQHFNYNGTTFAVVPYGPRWRSLRRIATLRLLSPARLSSFTPLHAANVRSLPRSLFGASTSSRERCLVQVNVRSRLTETTFDMIVEMITGSRCCVGEGKRFVLMAEEAFRLSSIPNPADFMPFLRWVGVNGLQKRMQRLEKEIDGLIEEIVDEIRRRRTKKEGKCTESGDANMTLVEAMLSMQEENPQVYTDNITKGMVEVLLLAGTDTTAVIMEWAMALLLNHPEALQKVHGEIEAHVGHQRLVADSDLSNLRYLNNVIKETLRLFPPGPLLVPRESTMECKVGGLHVPRGTMLLVNAHMVHRDPEVWANPGRFMPDRFETEEGEGYKFIPFGAGRRRCPGQALAEKTMGLALASLVQCFEWRRLGEEEVDLTESEGLTAPMAVPLEALCKPRQAMREVLSQL